ncbi:MAG: hypothetical protein A3F67_05460 [Verrucomicrobia bacterium RIFCSPHIGHO2_12_FULL_41_10]|nr:MAG: hypothetical protein A3F67_05460 [Verrucomicrobia bacterium RIFCSPHIGHO2_12_FULL_41_10]
MKLFISILIMASTSLLFASSSQKREKASSSIQNEAPSEKELTISGKPQLFTFPDGATLIVEEDHSAPVVSVQAWCNTGSIHEGTLLGAGLSHILEHMLFKGTKTRAPGVIAQQVQDQGGYINAYTSYDRTVYWIDMPSAGVSDAVDILADVMLNATLPLEEYEKEQEVIRREFAMGYDNPDRMSTELLFRTAFHVSPFREPVIGHLDIYNKLTRNDVMAYYKRRYVPNNLCFVVVGDVNAEKIRKQLGDFLEKYPRQALEPVLVKEEPPQLGKMTGRETFPTELSRLNMAWKAPGVTSPDAPAVEILASILGSGNSSILNQEVREKRELVHQIGAGFEPLTQQEGLFYVGAITDPGKRHAAEEAILEQVNLLLAHGVTSEQLVKAKKGILSGHLHALTTMRGRASDYGSSWLETGNPDFGKKYLEAINRVTLEDITRVSAKYLTEDGLTIASLDPLSSNAKDPSKKKDGDSRDGASKKNEQTVQRNVQKFVLPNGLRLLIGEDHRLPLVSMVATFRGGLLTENAQDNGLTHLMATTITKGTASKTAEQIAQTIEQVGGSIGADSSSNSFTVSVEVMKPDFSLGLDLLADVLTKATFPKEEVDREKLTQLAAIKEEDDQMTTTARNLLKKKLFGTHPYALRTMGTPESVISLTPELIQSVYKQFAVGSNGVLAIFGDVNAKEVLAMVTQAFAAMPAGALALQSPLIPQELTTSEVAQATQPKQQAVIMKGFLGASVTNPDRTALELLQTACSDLGSRFFNRIREKQGLAYFVGASNSMGLAPGAFVFYLGTDPQKVDLARHEFDDEINKLAADGLTQEELDRAKKKLLGAEAIQNQSNAFLAAQCASDELMGLGFDDYQHRFAAINAVSLDAIRNVTRKYLAVPGSVETIVAPAGNIRPTDRI